MPEEVEGQVVPLLPVGPGAPKVLDGLEVAPLHLVHVRQGVQRPDVDGIHLQGEAAEPFGLLVVSDLLQGEGVLSGRHPVPGVADSEATDHGR